MLLVRKDPKASAANPGTVIIELDLDTNTLS
jgi:hypothetical protein